MGRRTSYTIYTLKDALCEALKPLETRMGKMETRMDVMQALQRT